MGLTKEKKTKSIAKCFGLKSTFAYNDKLVLTSFGKGNQAIGEKIVNSDGSLEFENANKKFDVSVEEKIINLYVKSILKTQVGNPSYTSNGHEIGKDYIGLKSEFEKEVFGKEYPADNIHMSCQTKKAAPFDNGAALFLFNFILLYRHSFIFEQSLSP